MLIEHYIHESIIRRQGKEPADIVANYVNEGFRVVSRELRDTGWVIHLIKHVDTRRYRLG
jgi:hypothetical protein